MDPGLDRTLCPVRALALYKERTALSRGAQPQMFVCFGEGKSETPASRATLSRWINDVIGFAYEHSNVDADKVHAKMHDLRSIANTLAFRDGAAMEHVMAAGYWKSPSTFASYYLADLSADTEGIYTLGPIVAGQRITNNHGNT